MPRVKRRGKLRKTHGEAMNFAIAALDLPEELGAELLGVPKYSDYVIRLALDYKYYNRRAATEQEKRTAWKRVQKYALAWYAENRPGEAPPAEPWKNEGAESE